MKPAARSMPSWKPSTALRIGERLKLARRSDPKIVAPEGGWQIRILENTDEDVEPGDIAISSELALPAKDESRRRDP